MENDIDPYDEHIAYILRDKRIQNRYSQEDIGKLLHLPKQTISRIENGKRKVSPRELAKLAKFFDLSIDELLDETTFIYKEPSKSYGENLPEYAESFVRDFEASAYDPNGRTELEELKRIAKDVIRVMKAIIKYNSEQNK
jgi:transcriptional regulator with XRE-family HTH domain